MTVDYIFVFNLKKFFCLKYSIIIVLNMSMELELKPFKIKRSKYTYFLKTTNEPYFENFTEQFRFEENACSLKKSPTIIHNFLYIECIRLVVSRMKISSISNINCMLFYLKGRLSEWFSLFPE